MDVLQGIDHAGDVVEVLGGGVAVFAGLGIHHAHRSACRSEVNVGSPRLHVMLGVLAVQYKIARCVGNRIFNESARKNQTPGVGQFGACFGHELDAAFRRIGQANVL